MKQLVNKPLFELGKYFWQKCNNWEKAFGGDLVLCLNMHIDR